MNNRPFPRPCHECGQLDTWPGKIAYEAVVIHDGHLCRFNIPELQVIKCNTCDEIYFDSVTDSQISEALQDHLTRTTRTTREKHGH